VTFSLVGRCARTGQLGAVITSSSPAVAARCAYARARIGAACSQNVTDPSLGPALLDRLGGAEEALAEVVRTARHVEYRQLAVVDGRGGAAVFSGERALGRVATARGEGCAAAGNLLADGRVPGAMVEAFEAGADAPLGDRLVAALAAGLDAGGEEGPVRSAGLVVVDEVPWPVTDLRVDWTEGDPVAELAALWRLWAPQSDAFVTRALDPAAAPAFGVPGDEVGLRIRSVQE
jgi:uncharacterized Ntn-hydrolase superfamily protein